MFAQSTDGESRVFDLSDGRVLFRAAGRAYYVTDYTHGQRLENQLKWFHNLSTLAIFGTFLASYWLSNWWFAVGALPVVLLMAFAERFVVVGRPEATDPAARDYLTARNLATESAVSSTFIWSALIALGPLMPEILRGRVTKSPLKILELALVVAAFALAAVQLLRQRRVRQEGNIIGEPRIVDKAPIVPR